jgi:DNA helicase-2/ATP-dependent DNA helicase PcrA
LTNKIDYKKVLNPSQLEAVTAMDGPVLVIAGAGSGKTRTLVYRVARLVEQGVPPEEILLLTFTRKAAQEMLERAAGLSDPRCRFVSGGTFHSLAHKTLRIHAGLLGYENLFTVLDRADMEEVVQSLVPELGIPKGTMRFPKRGTLANILSKAANLEEPIEQFVGEEYGQFLECASHIDHLGSLYEGYKKSHQLMDYDDLLLNLRRLLQENGTIREQISQEYRYVMVDEYQDTNTIQADIVKLLAERHRNIMVVGDDSQSIYSFRGANYRNMFDFPKAFPEAKKVKLEENYRSTQPILTFTNALMEQAGEQYTKCLFTRREGGELPKVIDTRTEPEQALFICRYIRDQIGLGRSISDFVVLFRAGYHSFELEAELTRQGMSYVKYGGFKFLESAHIKDFLAHLRVITNNDDAVSWVRILRLIKNVGRAKSQSLIKWMRESSVGPGKVGEWPGAGSKDKGLKILSELLSSLSSADMKPKKAVNLVMEYYAPILKEKYDDHPKRQKDLDQLVQMAGRYKKLRNFLDDLVLDPPTSTADLRGKEFSGTLTLSTVHSAKGLEWPVVFIIWVAEGRFPAAKAYGSDEDLEEERRLMYVAATRARDHLIMCYPGQEARSSRGSFEWYPGPMRAGLSSFIQDVPGDVVSYGSGRAVGEFEIPIGHSHKPDTQTQEYMNNFGLSKGDRVNHPAFGAGVVSRIIGNDKAEVLFRDVGKKLLHLEYTTLEKY